MRVLAARVVAARMVQEGAEFMDTFRRLARELDFSAEVAFDIATRVHSSGGFTRDLIYLRGLVELMTHLREGGALEPLYIGKIALRHLSIIEELRDRGVLRPPPLRPRFLERETALERLEALRQGTPLAALVEGEGA
jgi:hypothetical protein